MLTFLKRYSYIFSIFAIFFFLAGLLWNACQHGGDFKVFYTAGERFLNNGLIYDFQDGWSPFKYHPSWAVFFSAWALLPFKLSVLFFNIVNLGFWGLAARHWCQILNYKFTSTTLLIVVVLGLNGLSAETDYGQVNGFLFWGATQIFKWLESTNPKPLKSGALLAVLVSLKLNLGILLCYVLYKNWRSAIGFALGAAGLHLIVLLSFDKFMDQNLYQDWVKLLIFQSSFQFDTFEVQGVLRICYMIFGMAAAKKVWLALMALAILMGVYIDFSGKTKPVDNTISREAVNGSYWLALTFLFSPLAWWYQILYLFPIAFLMLKTTSIPSLKWAVRVCIGVFAFVGFNTLGRDYFYNFKNYMGYFAASLLLWGYFVVTYLNYSRSSWISDFSGNAFLIRAARSSKTLWSIFAKEP